MLQFYIALIIIATISPSSTLKDAQKCRFDRVHKMIAYNCANLKLNTIPKYLKTSIEILDASENRIRKLNKESFSQYTSLKFLYLFENMILTVKPGTFEQLEQLEALDLSSNGLTRVPAEIFRLPNLRKLYLADNELKNEGFMLIKRPVTAPLAYLNIASTEIDRIPDLGILPELFHLNVSNNNLKLLTPEQFAPLCQIKYVDLNGTNVVPCQCLIINIFMENELKRLPILDCGVAPKNCKLHQNTTFPEAKDYVTCLTVKEERLKQRIESAQIPWPAIAFFSCIALWCLLMVYAHCNRRPSNRPQQLEHVNDVNMNMQMQINPNTRTTLIM